MQSALSRCCCAQYVGIDERDPRRWILRDRNDFLRRWAANDTSGRTVILDMDTLSLAPNAPSGLLGGLLTSPCGSHSSCEGILDHHLHSCNSTPPVGSGD